MDVYRGTFQGFNSEMNDMEWCIRLGVAAVTTVMMFCCCCCCLWINREPPTHADFDSRNILQEIHEIERQSANYEEALRLSRKREQLRNLGKENLTSGEIGIRSKSWEALDENVIADYDNEYVVLSNCHVDDQCVVTNNEKDIDLNSDSKNVEGNTCNASNDSNIKSKGEDTVEKCDSSNETNQPVEKVCDVSLEKSDQCKSQDNDSAKGAKANVEDDSSKCDASNENNISTEDFKSTESPGA